jgi:hypothetical protein
MSDDQIKRAHTDQTRINIREDNEVRYWCEKIGCTQAELLDAIAFVGVMSEDVEGYLKRKKQDLSRGA